MGFRQLTTTKTRAFHLLEQAGYRSIAIDLDRTSWCRQIFRCFRFSLSDHKGSTSRVSRMEKESRARSGGTFLEISMSPRTCLGAVNCKVRVRVIARFVKLGQLRALGLGQFFILDPLINHEANNTIYS